MPFEITITRDFTASHQLRMYDGLLEPRHGHDWHVEVTAAAGALDSIGVVMDFHELGRQVDAILTPFGNAHLNDVEPFRKVNPSAENVAGYLAHSLRLPERVTLVSVEAWETPQCRARFRPAD